MNRPAPCESLVNGRVILYLADMKKYQTTRRRASAASVIDTAQQTRMMFQLLPQLVLAVARNEKTQHKFRTAVIHKLTRVESAISLVLVGQEAQSQVTLKHHGCDAEKLEESAKWAEEFISRQSEAAGLRAIRYIYSEDPALEPRHDRRRIWWGWEI